MEVTAEEVAYTAIINRCTFTGMSWSGIFPYIAPAGTKRPFVVFFLSGGGASNDSIYNDDANLIVTVKVVANSLSGALAGNARLRRLLDNMGEQDARPDGQSPIHGSDDWIINTTTAEQAISMFEMVDGEPRYHAGFQLRLILHEK